MSRTVGLEPLQRRGGVLPARQRPSREAGPRGLGGAGLRRRGPARLGHVGRVSEAAVAKEHGGSAKMKLKIKHVQDEIQIIFNRQLKVVAMYPS